MDNRKKRLLFFTIMTTLTIAIISLWIFTSPLFTRENKERSTHWARVQELTN